MSMIRHEQVGDVFLRDFDQGVINKLGAVIVDQRYYIPTSKVIGVDPPLFTEFFGDTAQQGEPMPGIPIIYANPASAVQRYTIPCIRLRREDPSPALERWPSRHYKYRRPAPGEEEITVQYRKIELTGYANYEQQEGGYPYDIPYTLTVEAAGRGARTKAHTLLLHCMRAFRPHSQIEVTDTLGSARKYWVFVEGPSELTAVADIRDRTIIFALSLRVLGELDLTLPENRRAMTEQPTLVVHNMSELP